MQVVPVVGDTISLDTMQIVPGSVIVSDAAGSAAIDSTAYTINPVAATLVWNTKPTIDSIKITYRTFAINFKKSLFRKDISNIEQTEDFLINPFSYAPGTRSSSAIIDFGNLDYNGSFSRGLTFGNSQDVALSSSFNLQISGFITEDIEVTAALTDNNIPVQPDGTTQQLQEFDRVFIQIRKKPHQLIVGDYEIGNPATSHFMRFYKNLQGGSYSGNFELKDSMAFNTTTSLAIAKGRFARNELNVNEGNQGPYKLTGTNGETFIVVLAGTEQVFINGRQLTRGSENDYVIDYNLGEVTFTPKTLITEDLRVIVEFEYSEQNYFRSLIYTHNEFKTNKLRTSIAFYSEQDNKNQPIQSDLTTEQKRFLTENGESITTAQFPGYNIVNYDPNRILYELKDTTISDITFDTVFVYSSNPDVARYALTFTYNGANGGNYQPTATTANGRVFTWIAPQNGIPQGSYEPVVTLVTPKRRQMAVLELDYSPTKNDMIYTEATLTNDDLNTFSKEGSGDNVGAASLVGYRRTTHIGQPSLIETLDADSNVLNVTKEQRWYIESDVNYEFVNRNFRPLNRYRPVEFERNWNYLNVDTQYIDQHLAAGELALHRERWGNVSYGFQTFQVDTAYAGYMHLVGGRFDRKGYQLDFRSSFLTAEAPTQTTTFWRPLLNAEKRFDQLKGWRLGGRYEHDNKKVYAPTTDSLLANSFVFTEWRAYIGSPENDSTINKMKLEYVRRLEWRPLYGDKDLSLFTTSNTWNLTGAWLQNRFQKLEWQATYRRFENKDTTRLTDDLEQYYLGRIQYDLTVLKGAITSSTLYELGAGQEQRRDYTYLPVNTGEGTFIWIDYNDNGLQESNEFEVASFQEDTMYIRVLNPTNEYDPVNITVFNQILNLTPRAAIGKASGILGIVSRFSSVTALQLERKVFRTAGISPFNPFLFNVDDTTLVATSSNIRNTVFFNRTDTRFNLEYTFQDNNSKVNLTSGFETRRLKEHLLRPRVRLVKTLNLIVKYTRGNRSNKAQLFANRTYNIQYNELEPELTYLLKSKFRVGLKYLINVSQNIETGGTEDAKTQRYTLETRYSIISKTSIAAKFSYATVQYNGAENTPLQFAVLQGLQNGDNYIWEVSFDRTLGRNIQLNLSYEGRKTGTADMVHIGRAQVRAVF